MRASRSPPPGTRGRAGGGRGTPRARGRAGVWGGAPPDRAVADAVVAESLPGNVAAVWARPYDPDAAPDVFPGDLAERRDYPLNSVVFLWVAALDASGLPVFDAEPPATVRMRVPTTQWVDAAGLQPGNGRRA